jgi:hypothetical protein
MSASGVEFTRQVNRCALELVPVKIDPNTLGIREHSVENQKIPFTLSLSKCAWMMQEFMSPPLAMRPSPLSQIVRFPLLTMPIGLPYPSVLPRLLRSTGYQLSPVSRHAGR